jgi:hypothetical protein
MPDDFNGTVHYLQKIGQGVIYRPRKNKIQMIFFYIPGEHAKRHRV